MTLRSLASIFVAVLITAASLYSQQAQTDRRYLSTISLKVAGDKAAAFREHYKTGPGAKMIQARMKANPKILRYSVIEAIFPGDPAPPANVILATVFSGPPSSPDNSDTLYRAATGMTYAEYMQKVRSMSEYIGGVLMHTHHTTTGYGVSEGDIVELTRIKYKPGKTAQEVGAVMDTRIKLMDERVKSGGALKGWGYSHMTVPGGESLRYDAVESRIYKDLQSAIPGPGTGGGGGGTGAGAAAAFSKLFPNRNFVQYVNSASDSYTVVRRELYRVIATFHQ